MPRRCNRVLNRYITFNSDQALFKPKYQYTLALRRDAHHSRGGAGHRTAGELRRWPEKQCFSETERRIRSL
jgi:hypothetical protein